MSKFTDWLTYKEKSPEEEAMYIKASKVAERWKKQYKRDNGWYQIETDSLVNNGMSLSFDTQKIYENLLALGKSPTPKQVNDVIGNDTWTSIKS